MKTSLKAFLLVLCLLLPQAVLAVTLFNPLGTTNINVVIGRVISAILGLSGAVALLMFTWGGFQWILSRGDTGKVKTGKDTMIWASFGLVIIFTSYILVTAVINTLTTGDVLQTAPKGPNKTTTGCPSGTLQTGYNSDGTPMCEELVP